MAKKKKSGYGLRSVARKEEPKAPLFRRVFAQSASPNLVPPLLAAPLLLLSLGLPNIIFSGLSWFDTLHIMKWFVTLVPVGILCVAGGLRLGWYGPKKLNFSLGWFGWGWCLMLLYLLVQLLWVNITSVPTFVKEWFSLAAMAGLFILARNLSPRFWSRWLKWILLLALANASLNTLFAELQKRGLSQVSSLIMDVPKYLGNTGQMNMFGLWCAMAVFGGIYLVLSGAFSREKNGKKSLSWLDGVTGILLVISFWGLWNSTSRSAILSLVVGLFFLGVAFLRKIHVPSRKRLFLLLFLALLPMLLSFSFGRGAVLAVKSLEIVKETQSIAGRDSIWATAYSMVRDQPLRGVGLGHFKWNYLKAQRTMFQLFPSKPFRYTYWAHNEILQWFAEAGLFGGLLMVAMLLGWFTLFMRALWRRQPLSWEALWANGFLCFLWFNALWTRPLHRVEDFVWIAVAFGIAFRSFEESREIPERPSVLSRVELLPRALGVFMALIALGGMAFLADGMAGDKHLRSAYTQPSAQEVLQQLKKGEAHLMKRWDARHEQAQMFIRIGKANQRKDLMLQGLNGLYKYFNAEPNAADLKMLLDWSQALGSQKVLQDLLSYPKPGMFGYGNPPQGATVPHQKAFPDASGK